MLMRLLRRSGEASRPSPVPNGDALAVLPPEALLSGHGERLAAIRALVGVPDRHWDRLYAPLFASFAGLVQQLPASEAHHHAGPGGLLRHSLEVVHEALKLRQGALLPPGAPAEALARLQDLWTYACATAALLHDIGKPVVDQEILLLDAAGRALGGWTPLAGPMPDAARAYRVTFPAGRRHRRHERVAALLAHRVVPGEGLQWLASDPQVFELWLATLQGDLEEAAPLGDLVARADQRSVARDLAGGVPAQLPTARRRPLAELLMTGLRHLLTRGELPLNRPGAAAFLEAEDLWLVSKRVLDALREHLTRDGASGIPTRNDRLMDELQGHGLLVPNGDRAIWTCEVRIGDWRQRLTLLRMKAARIWPDPAQRPEPLDGAVVPVIDDAPAGDTTPAAADPPEPSSETPQASADGPSSELVPPARAGETLDGLPLPPEPSSSDEPDRETAEEASPEDPDGPEAPQAPADEPAPPQELPWMRVPETDAGRRFVAWLVEAIRSGQAVINTASARLHVLPQGLALVSPGIFRDFDPGRWHHAQKRFQKLRIHRKRPDGTNVWTCRVEKDGKRSALKVFLIPDPEAVLGVRLPAPNRYVTLVGDPEDEETADG